MNIYLIIILIILIGGYLLNLLVEFLNVRSAGTKLPDELKGYYDPKEYSRSQQYLKENTYFGLIHSGFLTFVFLVFILGGTFDLIDKWARCFGLPLIPTGLLFSFALFLILELVNLPFLLYHTFCLEQKYGFNRTSAKTFVFDKIKSFIISILLGAVVLSFFFWFFDKFRVWGWVLCWLSLNAFELFLLFAWPRFVMPLFNKFEAIEEGELAERIRAYARRQNFKIEGIYKMDASRRSAKSNAFFTGLGKFKRIVLFDTLIQNHTAEEIVPVLAHEIGHYRKKHLLQMIFISFLTNGAMLYILSLFIKSPGLFAAFKMENVPIYAGLFFFAFLYAPVNSLFAVLVNFFSRRHEKEADYYAVLTSGSGSQFIRALKKLSVKNLSNLTPHPAKVILAYSHPPILERIRYIRKYMEDRGQN